MDREQKARVLRLFLQFIQQYVPLNEAVVASLGGEGREARIWQESGIQDENGWLIERKLEASKNLIKKLPYHYTPSLANFPKAFSAVNGSNFGIDGFHLDLCGTIEPHIEVTRRLIPLILKSRGRCLAITVADARRNLSVEGFRKIEDKMQRVLGIKYDRLHEHVIQEQGDARGLAVMREIGLFYHLMELFRFYGRFALPDKVVRYSYVSYSSGNPFPMRTYVFHFRKEPVRLRPKAFAKQLYGKWLKESLRELNGARPVSHPASNPVVTSIEEAEKMTGANGYEKLRVLAQAAGGEILQQFDAMHAQVSGGGHFRQFMEELGELIAKHQNSADYGVLPEGKTKRQSRKTGQKEQGKHEPAAQDNGKKLDAQLSILKARAKGPKATEEVKEALAKKYYPRKNDRMRIIGAWEAHAVGKGNFMKNFLKRLNEDRPKQMAALLPDLANWYTKVHSKVTTVEDLRELAGL